MQMKDNIEGFDLQVREMLQDASVKAPRGVWKAVSRRLSSDGSLPVSRLSFAGWAAASLSFAAILCAGIFFSWDRGNNAVPELQAVPYTAQIISSGNDWSCPIVSEPESSEHVISLTASKDKARAQKSVAANNVTTAKEETEECVSAGEAPAERNDLVAAVLPKETGNNENTGNCDPFAEMERQDLLAQRNKRRPSIAVSGNLSGNSEFSAASSLFGSEGQGSGALAKTGLERFGIPLQLGAGIRIPLAKDLSLGAGISYSFLSSAYDAEYKGYTGDVRHNMNYIGIPVNIFYSLVQIGTVNVYAHTGGSAEYCVSNKYIFRGGSLTETIKEPVKGFMFSAGAGLGMEFKVAESIGIYLDPSFRYYFHCDHPESIRTEKPQTFNFEAGIRFNL